MKIKTKEVRITVNFRPITNLSTGVILSRGTYATMVLSESDIFNCICGKAIVEEKLSDGSFKKLDLFNYNKPNNKVNDSDEESREQLYSPVVIPSPKTNGVNSSPVVNEQPEQHALVRPDVAPISQKELINPSANIAGMADKDNNDIELAQREEDIDAEHIQPDKALEQLTEQGNVYKNNTPKGYNANDAKNQKNIKRG